MINYFRRNSNGSLSCQSSVISSLDVSLEECVITDTTDTDSGIFNPRHSGSHGGLPSQSSPRLRVPSGSSESNTPRSDEEDEEEQTPPSSPDDHKSDKKNENKFDYEMNKKIRRRNSEKAEKARLSSSESDEEQ